MAGPCFGLLLFLCLFPSGPARAGSDLTLYAVTYPEGRTVGVELEPTNRAPKDARIAGDVAWSKTMAKVRLKAKGSEPAVLFGGDVTCYVAWAVTPEGAVENLGELPVHDGGGTGTFRTTRNGFALIVTAEPHPATLEPSPIVVAWSSSPDPKAARYQPFAFSGFSKRAPRTDFDSLASLRWTSAEDDRVVQARRTLDVAATAGTAAAAGKASEALLAEARQLLAQAEASVKAGRRREAADLAQRSLAKSREAITAAEKTRADEAAAPKNR